jgi:hypothetical protein
MLVLKVPVTIGSWPEMFEIPGESLILETNPVKSLSCSVPLEEMEKGMFRQATSMPLSNRVSNTPSSLEV